MYCFYLVIVFGGIVEKVNCLLVYMLFKDLNFRFIQEIEYYMEILDLSWMQYFRDNFLSKLLRGGFLEYCLGGNQCMFGVLFFIMC